MVGAAWASRSRSTDGTKAYFKAEQTFSAANWFGEVAAYHLDRMLGLGRVPCVVSREFPWADAGGRRRQRRAQGRDDRQGRQGARRVRGLGHRRADGAAAGTGLGALGARQVLAQHRGQPVPAPRRVEEAARPGPQAGRRLAQQGGPLSAPQPAPRARPRRSAQRAERPDRLRLPHAQPRSLGRRQRQRAGARAGRAAGLPRQRRRLRARRARAPA